MLDGYLQLYRTADELVEGESSVEGFGDRKPIEVRKFALGGTAGPDPDEPDDGDPVESVQTLFADEPSDPFAVGKLKSHVTATAAASVKASKARWYGGAMSRAVQAAAKTAAARPTGPSATALLTFNVTKDVDSASPDLFQAYCAVRVHAKPKRPQDAKLGQFEKAVVTLRKQFGGEQKPYLVLTFERVSIVDYQLKLESGRGHLEEEVKFKFAAYAVRYQAQAATGAAGAVAPEAKGTLRG